MVPKLRSTGHYLPAFLLGLESAMSAGTFVIAAGVFGFALGIAVTITVAWIFELYIERAEGE